MLDERKRGFMQLHNSLRNYASAYEIKKVRVDAAAAENFILNNTKKHIRI